MKITKNEIGLVRVVDGTGSFGVDKDAVVYVKQLNRLYSGNSNKTLEHLNKLIEVTKKQIPVASFKIIDAGDVRTLGGVKITKELVCELETRLFRIGLNRDRTDKGEFVLETTNQHLKQLIISKNLHSNKSNDAKRINISNSFSKWFALVNILNDFNTEMEGS